MSLAYRRVLLAPPAFFVRLVAAIIYVMNARRVITALKVRRELLNSRVHLVFSATGRAYKASYSVPQLLEVHLSMCMQP